MFGRFDRRLVLRQRRGVADRRGAGCLAGLLAFLDVIRSRRAMNASAAPGLLRLGWRRRVHDRRQDMMARHGVLRLAVAQ